MIALPGFDPPPATRRSYTQRVTDRNNRWLSSARHPITGLRLADNGHTCGDCALLVRYRTGKTYLKCGLRLTHSIVTDTRASWPACTRWLPQEPK